MDADTLQFSGIQNAVGTRRFGCFGHEFLFAVEKFVVLVVDACFRIRSMTSEVVTDPGLVTL